MDKRKKVHNIDTILLDYYVKRAGMNSQEVADKLGISIGAYLNKRNGYSAFLVPEMYKLIEILKIPDNGDISQIFNPQ